MLQEQTPPTEVAQIELSLAALARTVNPQPLELAVVIPTYNERANIGELVLRLERVLNGIRFELIFVDDNSPDGTSEEVHKIAVQDRRVRLIRRIGRQGLSSACLEGMLATAAPVIAVMDADLQHDETVLRAMFDSLTSNGFDVVIGSRNSQGGSMGSFAPWRVALSNLGLKVSRRITRVKISDPMSGFFLIQREVVNDVAHRLSCVGFKILVDMLASSTRPLKVGEVAYTFRNREHGESKLDLNVGLEYLYLVLDKMFGDRVPIRFSLYVLMGCAGLLLHLGILGTLLGQSIPFGQSQLLASAAAMVVNFLLNNLVTHRAARLRGLHLIPGFLTYALACSVGLLINLSVGEKVLSAGFPWLWAGLAGLSISSVWNYGVTSVITWKRLKRRALTA